MDRLEEDLAGQASVLRLDWLSDVGKSSARRYGVRIVPTILVFDGHGQIVYRETGMPDADKIRSVIASLHQ